MAGSPVPRPSARVLVIGPGEEVLLLQYRPAAGRPEDGYWITPGGAIRPGEPAAEAAARELREETGIRVSPGELGPVIATSSGEWSSAMTVYAAHDSFFFLRVAETGVDTSGREELERSLILRHRWWTVAEVAASHERIFPDGLAGLLRSLLADGPPAMPVRLP